MSQASRKFGVILGSRKYIQSVMTILLSCKAEAVYGLSFLMGSSRSISGSYLARLGTALLDAWSFVLISNFRNPSDSFVPESNLHEYIINESLLCVRHCLSLNVNISITV